MAATRRLIQGAHGISYSLYTGEGLLADTLPAFLEESGNPNVVIITNETIAPLYGTALASRQPNSHLFIVPDGEAYKSQKTVTDLYNQLLSIGADRDIVIVALGGGVIGDLAGFVAATYLRGVRLIQCPTSLLAIADASIGGKVGIDLPLGKNLVGAFKDPMAIFQDRATLKTLPDIEFRCGLAEIIKAGLVGDPDLVQLLVHGDGELGEWIDRAVTVKIAMVEADREEKGQRAFLNLGHTFGHAIEQVSGYQIKHGLAVAIGLRAAAILSVQLGLLSEDEAALITAVLKRHNLPLTTNLDSQALIGAMGTDKKKAGGQLRFVLLEGIGKPTLRADIPLSKLKDTLEELNADPG
jgi:3-dehydroquinate synthase